MIDKTLDKINKLVPKKWQWILSHEGFRKYFKNTGWMFVGQMSNILSVIVGIWLARYLGPENFGIFSYVLAFVGLFSFITNLGVNDILTRDLVVYPEKRDKLLGTAFFLNLITGFLAFLVTVTVAQFIANNHFVKLLMIIWSTSFFISAFSVSSRYFTATVQSKKNAIVQVICVVSVSLFKILLIILNKGIFFLTIIYVFDYILSSILYLFFYYKLGLNPLNWKFDKKVFKEFLSVSWLMMLSMAASSIYMKIDQVMVKNYLGDVSVGLYTAAVRLVEVWYFIPQIICSSLLPAIINARLNDKTKYYNRLSILYKMLAVIAIVVAIPLAATSTWLINLFYGQAYISASPVLQVYIWSSLGLFLSFGLSQQLLAENRVKLLFIINLSAMLLNVALNLVFIPKFGMVGAAWATLFSYLLGPLSFFLLDKKSDNKINLENISIVVQGLVVGNKDDEYNKRYTRRCLDSLRKNFPGAQLILSTWERCDTNGLDFDILVKNKEPEDLFMVQNDGSVKLMTVNNQIISTNKGLALVDREYTLKIRSDIVVNSKKIIKYFEIFNRNNDSQFLNKRVLVLPTYNPERNEKILFDPCDWMYFGLTSDIKNIFDIPLMSETNLSGEKKDNLYFIKNNLEAEQYIWKNFLLKYKKVKLPYINYFTNEDFDISNESYARNLIMVPANKIGVKCLKMPKAGYGATPWLSQGLYTFSDYKKIYNKYNKKKIFYIPNFFENILYFIAYNSRLFIKKHTPNIYKNVVNFIRKINGSYNFLK